MGKKRGALRLGCGCAIAALVPQITSGSTADFRFDRDTLAFANSTVFEYHQGIGHVRRDSTEKEKTQRYTRRCFVMSRTVVQFNKFAQFDPRGTPLDDRTLAHRVRDVTRRSPWRETLPANERVLFPGYADLRQLSAKRGRILQENIGLGWPAYLRVGNFRMFYRHSVKYQEQTHDELNAGLKQKKFFIVYLSDYPTLHINHAVTVYAHKPGSSAKVDRYFCYDPNHPDGPRELTWLAEKREFNFQKDEEFVGGFTRAFHVYGKPFQ